MTNNVLYYYDITDYIDNKSEAENIQIIINYTQASGVPKQLQVDHIYVNVTYLPPHYTENWNLTYSNGSLASDGLGFDRGDTLNASAYWTSDNVSNAYVEHNGTGSFANYSVNGSTGYYPVNWTNYTLSLNNTLQFPKAGNVTVRMHAEDEYGQWNSTTNHYFTLWGAVNVTGLLFNVNFIVNGSSTLMYCGVMDNVSAAAIEGYNISFYQDGDLFNHSMTNSTGFASVLYSDSSTSAGNVTFMCNVTDNSTLYYNYSSNNSATNNMTITLAPLYTENWNLTYSNGTLASDGDWFNRTDTLNASAFWVTYELQTTYAEYNASGIFTNYTVGDNSNWTNHTINLTNTSLFPEAGNYTVKMHAQDIYGQWNLTTDHYFTLWGNSQITDLLLDTYYIINGSSTGIYCNVSDINSSAAIEGYNISFYMDNVLFNYSHTNSSGIATVLYSDTSTAAQNMTFKCNLTANTTLYYIPYSVNEQSAELNVSLPVHYASDWNLTYSNGSVAANGMDFYRTATVNASAFWTTDNLIIVYTEHDGNGSFVNYTIDPNTNWTNYTFELSNTTLFPKARNITIRMYARDIYDQLSGTDDRYFTLWSYANITTLNFNESTIINGSSTSMYCDIKDNTSSTGIGGYNVSFYKNDILFDYNTTNSTGVASVLYSDSSTSTENITFKCNITDNATMFYNASAVSSQSSNLSVVLLSVINLTTNYMIYNRGENLTFYTLYENNETAPNMTWSVSLTWYNISSNSSQEFFAESNINSTNYTLFTNGSYYVTNYTIYVNASKGGNQLTANWTFNISNTLTPSFTQPPAGTAYGISVDITPTPIVRILNARGEVLNTTLNATMICTGSEFALVKSGLDYANSTSGVCTAPATYSTSFNLSANATDYSNNTGVANLSLTTSAAPSGGNPGGGGGGGGGASPPAAVNCTCTDWVSFECGAGGCDVNSIYQTRTCTPTECSNETRCVVSPSCEGVIDFNFTMNTDQITITQGSTDNIVATIENTGDLNITLNNTIETECCQISSLESFELEPKESRDLPISVHVPLSQRPGQYIITVRFFYSNPIKEKTVKLNVVQNPLISKIAELEDTLSQLEAQIKEHKSVGGFTYQLEQLAQGVSEALDKTQEIINNDQPEQLENTLSFVESNIKIIEGQIANKVIEKALMENKFNIAAGILIALVVSYLITQILIPYTRLGKEINRLMSEEKTLVETRVSTEKQYFSRKIDEKTFQLMMIQGQEKLMKTKAHIKQKKEVKSTLVKSRLTPTSLYDWIKSGPKKLTSKLHRKKIQTNF